MTKPVRLQRPILFVDAYDSFAQNIAALLHETSTSTVVVIKIDSDIQQEYGCELEDFVLGFSAVVLGPGPGDPRHGVRATGLFTPITRIACKRLIPVLGICLGFQSLCIEFGLTLQRLSFPCHGHAKKIIPRIGELGVAQEHLFKDINTDNIIATCYNSLGFFVGNDAENNDSRPGSSGTDTSTGSITSVQSRAISRTSDKSGLKIVATDQDGYLMAVKHETLPLFGLQFHPESCKSNQSCHQLLKNWLMSAMEPNNTVRFKPSAQVLDSNRLSTLEDGCVMERQIAEQTGIMRHCDSISQTSQTPHLPAGKASKGRHDVPDLSASQTLRTSGHRLMRQHLHDMMLRAAHSSGSTVNWRQVESCRREHVARLVQSVSRESSTAMLESTKKGRFSIYALPYGLSPESAKSTSCKSGFSYFHLRAAGTHVELEYRDNQALNPSDKPYDIHKEPCPSPQQFKVSIARNDLIGAIEDFMISKQAHGGPETVPFWGGLLGFLSYEFGLEGINVNPNEQKCETKHSVDDVSLLWAERCLVHDSQTSQVYILTLRRNDQDFLNTAVEMLRAEMQAAREKTTTKSDMELARVLKASTITLPDQMSYHTAYDACQSHLYAGNSYELCLTTEARVQLPKLSQKQVYSLYRNMHKHNPVPYGALLNFPNITVLSTSPEQFMSWSRSDHTIDMMPMKGTVSRNQPNMTLEHATQILNTPKESAENLMIADLIRHDLYNAVGHTSKVEVIKLCEVIEHETVYQSISHIRAHMPISKFLSVQTQQSETTKFGIRALTSSLPPGSMTGAPKKKSCEILRDLENRRRGLYSGVLGYFDVGGGGAWNVCIRTAFHIKNEQSVNQQQRKQYQNDGDESKEKQEWIIGAGGAITVLSNRQAEWNEMEVKLNSVLRGFSLTSNETY